MAAACAIARNRLTRFVSGLGETSTVQKAGTALKAGFVGGIVTPLRGVAGNASWAGFRGLAGQPLQAGIDYIQSVGKSARTGFTVSPNEFREVVNATSLQGLKAFGRGFKAGADEVATGFRSGMAKARALPKGTPMAERIAEAVEELQAHLTADRQATVIDHPLVQFEHPLARTLADGAFVAVEVADRPFFKAANEMSLYMQAKLAAVKAGVKGAARDDLMKSLLANPTDDMQLRALMDAQYATFKDKNLLARSAESMRRLLEQTANAKPKTDLAADAVATQTKRVGAKAGLLAADLVIPFTGVPSSVAAKSLGVTPLGLLSPRMLGGQANRSLAIAHAMLGTGGIALGYELAVNGQLTGAFDANERADRTAQGQQEYSLKVGDTWVDLRTLGPAASSLFAGASLAKAHAKNPSQGIAGDVGTVAASSMKQTVENSYLQNVNQGIQALKEPEKRGANFVAGMIPIPSVLGQAGRAIDDTPREARTVPEKLMNRTPLSLLLPPKGTSFGDAPTRTTTERVAAPLSPLKLSSARDTPAQSELQRLGIVVGMPQRSMRVNKKVTEIPRDEYRAILKRQGEIVLPAVQDVITSREYRLLSDTEKRAWLSGIVSRAKAIAKDPTRAALYDDQEPNSQ